jgi:anthranilate phosphoribosyltransferase
MNIIKPQSAKEPYESLYKLNIGHSLDEYETEEAMTLILNEKDTQKRISLLTMLLNGIMIKGPTVNEITGLINASLSIDNLLTKKKKKIILPNNDILVGVASSGKKGIKTINITSAACFVAASCGANIAKACSHSTSSKTGSSDFLDICGIDINIPIERKIEILKKYHISFFSIEDTTPKFAEVYGGVFYAPHAMSFALAGLSFPIEIDSLAYGLSHPNVKLSAEVLKNFNIKNALIYSSTYDGIHYLDELLPIGCVNLTRIKDLNVEKSISSDIREALCLESNFNISSIKEKEDKRDNVLLALKILKGDGDKNQIDAICINASIFLLLAGKVKSMEEGYNLAKKILKTGKVWSDFLNVVDLYNGNSKKIVELINDYSDI